MTKCNFLCTGNSFIKIILRVTMSTLGIRIELRPAKVVFSDIHQFQEETFTCKYSASYNLDISLEVRNNKLQRLHNNRVHDSRIPDYSQSLPYGKILTRTLQLTPDDDFVICNLYDDSGYSVATAKSSIAFERFYFERPYSKYIASTTTNGSVRCWCKQRQLM